jgi:hypothetical protein
MSGPIRFNGPTGQQQPQNDTENQLFLFRQALHRDNITENKANGNNGIYDWPSSPYDLPAIGAREFGANR